LPKESNGKKCKLLFLAQCERAFEPAGAAAVRLRPQSELITKVGPACKSHKRKHTHSSSAADFVELFLSRADKDTICKCSHIKKVCPNTQWGSQQGHICAYCIAMMCCVLPSSARAQLHYCGNQHFSLICICFDELNIISGSCSTLKDLQCKKYPYFAPIIKKKKFCSVLKLLRIIIHRLN